MLGQVVRLVKFTSDYSCHVWLGQVRSGWVRSGKLY